MERNESDVHDHGSKTGFPIVGIGASAGGLEALKKFFSRLPSEPGMAFVIIQHKSPDAETSMETLMSNFTNLTIKTIEDDMAVYPDTAYLNPPDRDVSVYHGRFRLSSPNEIRSRSSAIDTFFQSLARDQKKKAIGIILSGTGTDGTLGLKAIKSEGGMAMVQDYRTSKFKGMPRSASENLAVDFVLSPEKMPEELVGYVEHPYVDRVSTDPGTEDLSDQLLRRIFQLIRKEKGHDFQGYKSETLQRRIKRQMAIKRVEDLGAYVELLEENPEDVRDLFYEILIDVTRFFRDPEAFDQLEVDVLPKYLEQKKEGDELRVWVVGCSTGEEVYSLAILFKELMQKQDKRFELKIFATDINDRALDVARDALYPQKAVEDLPEEYLTRYFVQENGRYRVQQSIRESIIFAEHNVLQDPPYSDIDFVSCRNLLIFLGQETQKKALRLFHYSLSLNGILFLGHSESSQTDEDLFSTMDLTAKVFRKEKETEGLPAHGFDFAIRRGSQPELDRVEDSSRQQPEIVKKARSQLIADYVPAGVLLDSSHNIVHFFGHTEKYLSHPEGTVSLNILDMCPGAIEGRVLTLLTEASRTNEEAKTEGLVLEENGDFVTVDVSVRPIDGENTSESYLLVVFEDHPSSEHPQEPEETDVSEVDSSEVRRLREELETTKRSLRDTIGRLKDKNEELQDKNARLQSLTEEYQSANEELITSKEELQSTNEELITTNDELEEKVQQQRKLNDYLENLLQATQLPVVFLDRDLNIERFTPEAKDLFNLIDSDVGRPLSDIASGISDTEFTPMAREVLDTLQEKEREVQDGEGNWYKVRVVPFRSQNDAVVGVILTFFDITRIKEAQKTRRLALVLEDSNDAVTLFDFEGNITAWNRGAEQLYGYPEAEAHTLNYRDLIVDRNDEELDKLIEAAKREGSLRSFRTKRIDRDGNVLEVWLTVTLLVDDQGQPSEIATTERNLDWLPENDTFH